MASLDPMNAWVAPNLLNLSNMVRVPGPALTDDDVAEIDRLMTDLKSAP